MAWIRELRARPLLVGLQHFALAASAAAAAPTRPVLVLAKALVAGLAAPADASCRESSRDVLVGVVRELVLNKKINQES